MRSTIGCFPALAAGQNPSTRARHLTPYSFGPVLWPSDGLGRSTRVEGPDQKEAPMSRHNGHGHGEVRAKDVSRRRILKGAAGLAATTSVPAAWIRRAGAAGKIVIRTCVFRR